MAVRLLPGGAAARPRRQRVDRDGSVPSTRTATPSSTTSRHREPTSSRPSHGSSRARGPPARTRATRRARPRLPPDGRYVVRRTPGERSRGDGPRRASGAAARAGERRARANRCRREAHERLRPLRPGRDATRAGGRSTSPVPWKGLPASLLPRTPSSQRRRRRLAKRLSGAWHRRVVKAAVDFWDDQDDVYAAYLRAGHRSRRGSERRRGRPLAGVVAPAQPSPCRTSPARAHASSLGETRASGASRLPRRDDGLVLRPGTRCRGRQQLLPAHAVRHS